MTLPSFSISLAEHAAAGTTTLSIQTDTLTASDAGILAAEIQEALKRFEARRAKPSV